MMNNVRPFLALAAAIVLAGTAMSAPAQITFIKVVDAQVDFTIDAAGKVTGLVLHQGGQDLPAKKIRTP